MKTLTEKLAPITDHQLRANIVASASDAALLAHIGERCGELVGREVQRRFQEWEHRLDQQARHARAVRSSVTIPPNTVQG